eukprot:6181020-Ditylum_brightwellii.AAC.1
MVVCLAGCLVSVVDGIIVGDPLGFIGGEEVVKILDDIGGVNVGNLLDCDRLVSKKLYHFICMKYSA